MAVIVARSRGRCRLTHSSSRRSATFPVLKRLGFPPAVWLGDSVTTPSPSTGRRAGDSPTRWLILRRVSAGWVTKSS